MKLKMFGLNKFFSVCLLLLLWLSPVGSVVPRIGIEPVKANSSGQWYKNDLGVSSNWTIGSSSPTPAEWAVAAKESGIKVLAIGDYDQYLGASLMYDPGIEYQSLLGEATWGGYAQNDLDQYYIGNSSVVAETGKYSLRVYVNNTGDTGRKWYYANNGPPSILGNVTTGTSIYLNFSFYHMGSNVANEQSSTSDYFEAVWVVWKDAEGSESATINFVLAFDEVPPTNSTGEVNILLNGTFLPQTWESRHYNLTDIFVKYWNNTFYDESKVFAVRMGGYIKGLVMWMWQDYYFDNIVLYRDSVWDEYKAQIEALSDDDLLMIPSYEIRTQVGAGKGKDELYHFLALNLNSPIWSGMYGTVEEMINAIHEAGGIVIANHPNWKQHYWDAWVPLCDLVTGMSTIRDNFYDFKSNLTRLWNNGHKVPSVRISDQHYLPFLNRASYVFMESFTPAALYEALEAGKVIPMKDASSMPNIDFSVGNGEIGETVEISTQQLILSANITHNQLSWFGLYEKDTLLKNTTTFFGRTCASASKYYFIYGKINSKAFLVNPIWVSGNSLDHPYVQQADKPISSVSWSNYKLTFTISAPSGTTSTTKVYVGEKGRPFSLSINGNSKSEGDGWTYNSSSHIVTVAWTHNGSDADIILGWNHSPTMGQFEAPTTVYANKYFYLNATIHDPNGIADFINATVEIGNDVILKWDGTSNTFSEYSDPNNYCTLDSDCSSRSIVNATTCKLSWGIKLTWIYPEGPVNIVAANTMVCDAEGDNGNASHNGFFTFEDDLIVYGVNVNDERINPNQNITFTGTLCYQGTTILPEDTNGITAKVNVGATLKGSNTTIGSDGNFFIGLAGEPDIGSFSYTVFATTDENSVQNRTIQIIVDRLNITFAASKKDPALGETVTISWTISRQYDNSPVTSFTIDISRKGTLWKSGLTNSSTTDTQSRANTYTYDVHPKSVTDATYNLTEFDSTPITISWSARSPIPPIGYEIMVAAILTAVLAVVAIGIKVKRLNKMRKV